MPPQKRPLILLHKCSECATFAVSTVSIEDKKIPEMETMRLRFSDVLRLNDNKQHSPKVGPAETVVDADDDSAYSSNNSGQNSPDDSPVSRSDSPSPTGRQSPVQVATLSLSSPNRPQLFRSRSMSESVNGGVPLKGILKRRPVMRFLSQCEEETVSLSPIGESEIRLSNDDCMDVSESGEDDDQQRERSQSASKKTVRFNDRVQEKSFRPNSSILGQRKKNQKKQQRKRKRTNSGDSQTGGSENENDTNQIGNLELESDELFEETPEIGDKIPDQKDCPKKEKEEPESPQRKTQRKAVVFDEKRYDGFMINSDTKSKSRRHRRRSSGDSALGDDEHDSYTIDSNSKRDKRRTISCGGSNDSGIDLE